MTLRKKKKRKTIRRFIYRIVLEQSRLLLRTRDSRKILDFNASSRAINYARSIIINRAYMGTRIHTRMRLDVIARSIYNAPYLRA